MTKFHEVNTFGFSTYTVSALELEDLIGRQILWQDSMSLSRSLGEILDVDFNLTSVLVRIRLLNSNEVRKFSFARDTKVQVVDYFTK